jgi:hypothetical protein
LFEPHGDDALISCYPLLLKHSEQILVTTVGESRDSAGLARYFPRIQTHYEGVYEIPNQIGRAAYLKDFRKWSEGTMTSTARTAWLWQLQATRASNQGLWDESYGLTEEFLISYLNSLYDGHYEAPNHQRLILAPIGLLHPYHICLATAIRNLAGSYSKFDFGFYSEAPYNSAKWVKAIEDSHPLAGEQVRVTIPSQDPVLKEGIFRDVYPTEVKIFRFTRDEVLKNESRFYIPPRWLHLV